LIDGAKAPPGLDSWTAAVYRDSQLGRPVGAAVLIDERRLITSAHVVRDLPQDTVCVNFPKSENPFQGPVAIKEIRYSGFESADLAILELAEPTPGGVRAARIRRPSPENLAGRTWSTFGFPKGDAIGNTASGQFGDPLAYGFIRLDSDSRYVIEQGHSGCGIWADDYGAVVAIVVNANGPGDGQAITFHVIHQALPNENILDLASWSANADDESEPARWGWSLQSDQEASRHWNPRARGVTVEAERGFRFRGRRKALEEIIEWLGRPELDHKLLVVTGMPGVGKSAVLGRIVTTADRRIASELPIDDLAPRAVLGSVGCAVHARGKTSLEVAREIARAVSAELPTRPDDLAASLRRAQRSRGADSRFNIVLDALDEASSPIEARSIAMDVVLPLAQTCADIGVQIVVGSRMADSAGQLVAQTFGRAATMIDLDQTRYSSIHDLEEFVLATIQLHGDFREANPYNDLAVAQPVAERIALLASGNYLVAGLMARAHGLYDVASVEPLEISFDSSIENAFRLYLSRVPYFLGVPAEEILLPLAYAQPPGMPAALWSISLHALTKHIIDTEDLSEFAHTAGASFVVVQAAGDSARPAFRLFHQGLSETLANGRKSRGKLHDHKTISATLIELGKSSAWTDVDPYLTRSIPAHAAQAGMLDEIILDSDYALNGDIQALVRAPSTGVSVAAMDRLRALRLAPEAVPSDPAHRAAAISLTSTLEGMPPDTVPDFSGIVPYVALWGDSQPSLTIGVLGEHVGSVEAMCVVEIDGRQLLAACGANSTLRIWDTFNQTQFRVIECNVGYIAAMCSIVLDGNTYIVVGSLADSSNLHIIDPVAGIEFKGFGVSTKYRITCVASAQVYGQARVLVAHEDGAVRVWDPSDARLVRVFQAATNKIHAMTTFTARDTSWVAVASEDDMLSVFNLRDGSLAYSAAQRLGGLRTVAWASEGELSYRLYVGGLARRIAVLESSDGGVTDIRRGIEVRSSHRQGVACLTLAGSDGDRFLVSGGFDGSVVRWDNDSREPRQLLNGHTGAVTAVAAIYDGPPLIASSSGDGIRLWDPYGRGKGMNSIGAPSDFCKIVQNEDRLLAGMEGKRIRIWEAESGIQRIYRRLPGNPIAFCLLESASQQMLAVASGDVVHIWDAVYDRIMQELDCKPTALGPVDFKGKLTLACVRRVIEPGAQPPQPPKMRGYIDLFDPLTKEPLHTVEVSSSLVQSVFPLALPIPMLPTLATFDGRNITVWHAPNPRKDVLEASFIVSAVDAYCVVEMPGAKTGVESLAVAQNGHLRILSAVNGETVLEFASSEQMRIGAVCALQIGSRALLVTGGVDQTLRVWDLRDGSLFRSISIHRPITELISHRPGYLTVRLSDGLLQLALDYDLRLGRRTGSFR